MLTALIAKLATGLVRCWNSSARRWLALSLIFCDNDRAGGNDVARPVVSNMAVVWIIRWLHFGSLRDRFGLLASADANAAKLDAHRRARNRCVAITDMSDSIAIRRM